MKCCTKCGEQKEFSNFHKYKLSKDGYKAVCKECRRSESKKFYQENKIEIVKKSKNYREENSETLKEKKRKYYLDNKEKINKKSKKYREENSEFLKEINKKYREENSESLKEKKKQYRSKEENKQRQKEWWLNNKDKRKEYRKSYKDKGKEKQHKKNWYKSIKYRKPYVLAWRSLLNNTLKRFGKNKEDETIKLLGYSALQLKEHIESLFLEGMSWKNYGDWHIDHIKMVSNFDKNTPVDIVNSLDNLRPLWARDNCSRKFN